MVLKESNSFSDIRSTPEAEELISMCSVDFKVCKSVLEKLGFVEDFNDDTDFVVNNDDCGVGLRTSVLYEICLSKDLSEV